MACRVEGTDEIGARWRLGGNWHTNTQTHTGSGIVYVPTQECLNVVDGITFLPFFFLRLEIRNSFPIIRVFVHISIATTCGIEFPVYVPWKDPIEFPYRKNGRGVEVECNLTSFILNNITDWMSINHSICVTQQSTKRCFDSPLASPFYRPSTKNGSNARRTQRDTDRCWSTARLHWNTRQRRIDIIVACPNESSRHRQLYCLSVVYSLLLRSLI